MHAPTASSKPCNRSIGMPDPTADGPLAPNEEHFHVTGNEGASFERTYRRAALVLWPSERIFAVLSQAGLPVTLPYLDDLTRRWAESAGINNHLSGARRMTSPAICSRNGRRRIGIRAGTRPRVTLPGCSPC